MYIDDSDRKTICDALRASYNWSRNCARTEEGEIRDGYIKDAARFKVVLDKLRKPRVNMNNCQKCGKFREHGHECKPYKSPLEAFKQNLEAKFAEGITEQPK